ncbi:cyclic nucleotide-binding domain-containing protein [Meridianimarinicoccus aquatilis]|uniref:Cyclic nucleotide-binding domain-containing protein n=1 Tax=Meridianimarinicoccus aquatilis TaxID=2552766 RepID=A0A4R6B598_9RHOB|nr:cyclic nucleotide-binding domain-containing protein [Fluviibacterium aquatile]TDL90513.1 cyclic nucleotide-binding domain-containing protein [Fluviibacterium aquatile]
MGQLTLVEWVEALGWLASILTVATYSMNTMIPLRVLAIVSSLCFVIYALVLQLWPLLAMELILLPINAYRLWQILTLRGRLARGKAHHIADGHPDFSVMKTYGKSRRFEAGTVIFERGDRVDQLYYVASGRVLIPEFQVEMAPGDIFGEIAFFTDAAKRTATARCIEETHVYELDEKRFMMLQFEDPSFGLSVMRTMTRRLLANKSLRPSEREV